MPVLSAKFTFTPEESVSTEDAHFFLGATKHLYNWLCPLVGRSVGRLVCGVTHSFDDPHVAPIGLLGLVEYNIIQYNTIQVLVQ